MRALVMTFLLCGSPALANWPTFDQPVPQVGEGTADAAVVIGIGDYLVLPDIEGAAENARDWGRYLLTTRGIPNNQVKLLINQQATKESIEAALVEAVRQVKPGGTFWFIFIGHGAPAPGHEDGLILGVDTMAEELSLVNRGLPQKRVLELIEAGPQEAAVTMFDACFSGTIGDGKTQLVKGSQATVPVKRVDVGVGRTAILSASAEVAGPLPQHNRPAFTYLMLGAVRGWADKNKDQSVMLSEAFEYTRDVLVTFVTGRSQVPSLAGRKELNLARGAIEQGPDLIARRTDLGTKNDMFSSSALTPPPIDLKAFANAGSLSQGMDIEVERARDRAVKLASDQTARAEDKRDAWCKLAGYTEKNSYRGDAERLCLQWKKFVEDETKVLASLGNDYNFLVDYFTLDRTDEQKMGAMRSFIEVYGKYTTRQEVIAARAAWVKLQKGEPITLEKDTDLDGLIIDACPLEKEDFDGDADDDGCPETTAGEALGNLTNSVTNTVDDGLKAVDEAGFHLHVLNFTYIRLDTGLSLGFGLWDDPKLVPSDFRAISFRPAVSLTNRVTWGPLEAAGIIDWDLSRDFDNGGVYLTGQAGARIFGIGPWTPSFGVDYRNALGISAERGDDLGVYLANSVRALPGTTIRLTYRYSLADTLGASSPKPQALPPHAIFLEFNVVAIDSAGSTVADIFKICD